MRKIDKLGTNYYGHSFLKRYYLFGLPGYLYDGEPGIIEQHLEAVAADLVSLFNTGVFVGETGEAVLWCFNCIKRRHEVPVQDHCLDEPVLQ